MAKIVVIGAGVAGLTTALLLVEKGHEVAIVARNLPGDIHPDYTSPFAGANWASFASDEQYQLQQYDAPGYSKFLGLAQDPKSGVWVIENLRAYKSDDVDAFKLPWFKSLVEEFKVIDDVKSLPPGTVKGYSYKGVVISTSIYLNYLLQKIVGLGVVYRRAHLSHIDEAHQYHPSGKPDLVVNCTGLLSKYLGGVEDKMVYPIRGQTMLVRNNAPKKVSVSGFPGYPDESLYVMTRKEGGSIIGGCFQVNNHDKAIDHAMMDRLKERALKYVPELVDPAYGNPASLDIVRYNVGFRPGREGGPRLEIDPNCATVIHNYGAAGAGYQSSYGMSGRVVELVNQVLSKPKL